MGGHNFHSVLGARPGNGVGVQSEGDTVSWFLEMPETAWDSSPNTPSLPYPAVSQHFAPRAVLCSPGGPLGLAGATQRGPFFLSLDTLGESYPRARPTKAPKEDYVQWLPFSQVLLQPERQDSITRVSDWHLEKPCPHSQAWSSSGCHLLSPYTPFTCALPSELVPR